MSATNRGRTRVAADLYPTPEWAIRGLRAQLHEDRVAGSTRIGDPTCGDGRILRILGEDVVKSRKRTWKQHDLARGQDYYHTPMAWNRGKESGHLMVSNLPFSHCGHFVYLTLERDRPMAACYLLRLNFLGSLKRMSFLREHTPVQLMVLTPRPIFVWVCMGDRAANRRGCGATYEAGFDKPCTDCGGKVTAGSDACEYAWMWWGDKYLLRQPNKPIVWINKGEVE